jgi:hypothetical protein
MHFLIFVPRQDGGRLPTLADAGLADFAAGAMHFDLAVGPGKRAGVLFGWVKATDAAKDFGYFPDRQTWIESKPAGQYWLGLWKGSAPTPAELLRPFPFRGSAVALGDGNAWIVPAAAKLPKTTAPELDEHGNPKFTLDARFARYWQLSERYFAELADADFTLGEIEVDAGLWHFAVEALRMNYRLVPELVAHLGLLAPSDLLTVLAAAIDLPNLEEVLAKKKRELFPPAC